mgnify:CR=1 FL=1
MKSVLQAQKRVLLKTLFSKTPSHFFSSLEGVQSEGRPTCFFPLSLKCVLATSASNKPSTLFAELKENTEIPIVPWFPKRLTELDLSTIIKFSEDV